MAQAWYVKAANQNYGPAQFNLGRMYAQGLGVEKDPTKSGDWYRKAYGLTGNLASAVRLVDPAELTALRTQVAAQSETIKAREAEVASLKTQVASLEAKSLTLAKANSEAATQLAGLQQQMSDQRASLAAALSRSAGDLSQISAQTAALEATRRTLSDREAAMAQREQDIARKQADLDQQARTAAAAARADVSAFEREIADLRAKLAAGQAQLAVLETGSRAATGERDAALAQLTDARTRLEANLRAAALRETDLQAREKALAAAQASQAGNATLATATIEASRRDLETQRKQIETDRAAVAAQRAQLAVEANAYQAQLVALSDKSAKADAAQARLAEAAKQIDAREATIVQRELALAQASGALATQQDQRRQLDAERARLAQDQTAFAAAQQQYADRIKAVQQKEQASNLDRADLQSRAQQLEERERTLKQREVEVAQLRARAESDAEAIRVLRERMDEAQKILVGAPRGGVEPTSYVPETKPQRFSIEFGQYYAILIANEKYQDPAWPRLETPVVDVTAIADLLEQKYGFKVKILTNADRATIMGAIEEVGGRMKPTDNLLIYYAGHGREIKETNLGYWEPVDSVADFKKTTRSISAAALSEQLSLMDASKVLVISDSCFAGAMQTRGPAAVLTSEEPAAREAYLRAQVSRRGRALMTSGNREQVADGGGRGHSVFADAMITELTVNDDAETAQDLFVRIHARIVNSGIPQDPQYVQLLSTGHEGGEFIFVPANRQVASR